MSLSTPRAVADRPLQIVLYALSGLCVVGALGHALWPDRVDEKTLMFLGLAAVMLVIRDITTIEFPGWKIEKVRQELKGDVAGVKADVVDVDRKVGLIEENSTLPGAPRAPAIAAVRPADACAVSGPDLLQATVDTWSADPNKRKFGEKAEQPGRRLTATLHPAAGADSAACQVRLRVEPVGAAPPLEGDVVFLLHPTFGSRARQVVRATGGVAQLAFTSWGAFTVGVEADDGATRLELDLESVPGGTAKFYSQ